VTVSSPIIGSRVLTSTDDGDKVELTVTGDSFSMKITGDFFKPPKDGVSEVTVSVNILVNYVGGLKKRMIAEISSLPTFGQSMFTAGPSTDDTLFSTPDSSGSVSQLWSPLLIVLSMLCFLL